MTEKEYKKFKKVFWDWFDSLPTKEKRRFWYFKQDMAETYFFLRHYEGQRDAHEQDVHIRD